MKLLFSLAILILPSALIAADFDWPDRRPIGAIFLATSGKNWPKNPRGYFNDPEIDVSTPEGKATLRQRMMSLADESIAHAKDVGAQGVIVWDIEGGEMPHAVTYLGDPRILPRVAPEMDEIADDFFAKFREAGLITGVCIRPSTIVYADEGNYPWIKGRYGHVDGQDPVGVLADKIAYAKKRWGCTNFYVDTNVTPRMENGVMARKKGGSPDFRLLTGEEIAELRKRHPDVLIWPEFQEPDYFASSSGYGEYHQVGKFSAAAREKYPKAFRVWMPRLLPTDIYANWQDFLDQGVFQGEVFLFECSPSKSPMGEVLKNAASEVALRQREPAFVPAKSTAEKIQQLQTSESWAERRVIVDALGTDSSEAATEALTHVLKEEISELQEFAGRALGRQATPASLEVLRAMATMKEPSLMASKLAATRGLGVSKKQESLEILLPMLQSEKEPSMRWAALDAIAEIGHASAGPALMEYLQSLEGTSANTSRNKTVRALGLTGDPSAIPILQAALKNPEFANSRRAVIEALTRLGAPPKS